MKLPCPNCGTKLEVKAQVDSSDRIWSRWHYCPKSGCGYDERVTPYRAPSEQSTKARNSKP